MFGDKKLPVLIIFFLASLIIFLLDRTKTLDPIYFPARRSLAPVQLLFSPVTGVADSVISYLRFVSSGEARIKNLEQRNIELLLATQELRDLRAENEDLRKQLGENISRKLILRPARVLGVSRFLELAVEDESSVRPGQPVIYLNNLVGVVVKSGSGVGFVRLISDPESKVPAKTDRASGIAEGAFASGVTLEKVSRAETLTEGDLVLTSGVGGQTPPGLAVGRVEKISSSSDDLFQKAKVALLLDYKKLRTVFLIDE